MSAINPRTVAIIAKRQLASYLANPLGYLIILVFVIFSGFLLFWREEFFERNIADLALLYPVMPGVLAVLLPLLAMSAWSAEREHGTDELLLTLPVTIGDAVLGKFKAIIAFFTLSLLFTLANVAFLIKWGEPDLGLVAANYIGWWLMGLAYASFALLGSVLVRSQVIAFVLGAIFCGALMGAAWLLDWTEPFSRGLLPLGAVLSALGTCVAGLGLCMLVLAARRWRSQLGVRIGGQLLATLLGIAVCIQVGRIAYRWNLDVDISVDGIASISDEAEGVVEELDRNVRMHVVITDDDNLNESLRLRAEEILNRAKALARAAGGRLRLDVLRPEYALDADGERASEAFGLDKRGIVIDTVAGPQEVEVFLGAHMSCGTETVKIPYFEPGMNPEYELVRALRSVTQRATEPEPTPVTLTVALPAEPHPSIADKVDEVQVKLAELEEDDEHLTIERIVIDDVNSSAGDRALALDMVVHRIEAGAIETPDESDDDGDAENGPDDGSEDDEDDGDTENGAEDGSDEDDADGDAENGADDGEEEEEEAPPPEPVRCIFGAVAESERFKRSAPYLGEKFDAGDAVEDLVADLRDMTDKRLPVLGVLKTDLQVNGGFAGMPMQGRMPQRNPPWEIISELENYYQIRDIDPSEINDESNQDVDVLLALLPSSLTQDQMPELMRYVWEGRAALLMVDPLPILPIISEGKNVAPAAPKWDPMAQYRRGQMPSGPEKGNLVPLISALGVNFKLQSIAWYNFIPGRSLEPITKAYRCVWLLEQNDCIDGEHPVTRGIDSLMALAPGVFYQDLAGTTETEVEPLVWLNREDRWGIHTYSEMVRDIPPQFAAQFGAGIINQEVPYKDSTSTQRPLLVAEISGPVVYSYDDGFVKQGTVSEQPCQVILVSDTDLIHDAIYSLYLDRYGDRDADREDYRDDREVLRNLRNIQFVANCIDRLAGDPVLMKIRSRNTRRRPLVAIDRRVVAARNKREEAVEEAAEEAEDAIEEIEKDFNTRVEDLIEQARSKGWDRRTVDTYHRALKKAGQAKLDKEIARINRKKAADTSQADRDLRDDIAFEYLKVRILVIVIPSVLLLLIMVLTLVNKLVRERTDIPANRKRSL